MLVASAALAGLLLGAYFLTPAAQLHYHAWRYRSGRDADGTHLMRAARLLVKDRAHQGTVARILGVSDQVGNSEGTSFMYCPWPHGYYMPDRGVGIVIDEGRATRVLFISMPWKGTMKVTPLEDVRDLGNAQPH
jgi:hypothetical protein